MDRLDYVHDKLNWLRREKIWPNGLRYLWTDAFGVILLVSLYAETGRKHYLDDAEWLVAAVDRVLGRARGIRIGEAPDRDGQYFHYLAMWLYALAVRCSAGRYPITANRALPWYARSTMPSSNRTAACSGR